MRQNNQTKGSHSISVQNGSLPSEADMRFSVGVTKGQPVSFVYVVNNPELSSNIGDKQVKLDYTEISYNPDGSVNSSTPRTTNLNCTLHSEVRQEGWTAP